MMNKHERSLPEIVELASAFHGSAVLFTALEVNVFGMLAQDGCGGKVEQLAAQSGLNERGLRLLLDACVAIGILRKDDDVYANTEAGAITLVPGGQHDLSRAIAYNRDVYPAWGRLAELVRSGRPVEAPEEHLGADEQRTRRFVLAMHGRAMGIGRAVIPMIELPANARVLDLAGGPGTYATLLAQTNPSVSCVTMDLPAITAVAKELVAAAAMERRVTCIAGDYHSDHYQPESFEAATIFGALHQEAPAMIQSILQRVFMALKPGGHIYVLDMMTDATRANPPFSALFAINMALTTHNGWVFSDADMHGWLRGAGFVNGLTRPVPPPMPHWLVSAMKPH